MLRPLTDIKAFPLQGGAITRTHKGLLSFGAFSAMQDMRNEHPGLRKRPGQIKLHSTADSTNEAVNGYQFRKQRIDEKHFLVQWSDGDVHAATTAPPGVTTGAFGTELYSGTGTGEIPASFSVIDDTLLYSNGVNQHKVYAGENNYVDAVIVYSETSAAPDVPEKGVDYTIEATDGLTTTAVILDSFRSNANHAVFVHTPVPATQLTFTIGAANGNASTGTLSYRKNDNTWADTAETDGTISGTATMGQSGSMTWARPSDEIPCYMYGRSGYWYRWTCSAQLDSEVEITKITYGHYASNSPAFESLENVWDGIIYAATEVMVEGTTQYSTYGATAVDLGSLTSGKKIMIASPDPLMGIYADVGVVPNATGTAITSLKYWNGTAMVSVGTPTDGTSGLSSSGWITFPQQSAVQPMQFEGTQYYAYWYELIFDQNLTASMSVAFFTMPYFNIEELGKGYCSAVWKNRGIYSFTLYGNYIYVSVDGKPLSLNGDDYGILKAGDGRSNKVVAMRKFFNELMVFQEEKGVEGGCITVFAGYSPDTFGKQILNSTLGTFSNKTVDYVSGVKTSAGTEEGVKDLVFFLSRNGVCATDGISISIISDDIQNYFNPTESECIRRGYEKKMWLKYDSAFNVLRLGLVSGSTATLPNVFPVFDLETKTWSFDNPAQELSFLTEAEAGSGNVPVVQIAGGIDDGTVYLSNSGTNDVSTAIDSYFTMELNNNGEYIQLNEVLIQAESVAASAGDITMTFTQNSISAGTKTLSMSPEVTNQTIRRHRFPINIQDQNISIKVQNNAASKEMKILSMGVKTQTYEGR